MPFVVLQSGSRGEREAGRSRAIMRCVYLLRSVSDAQRRYVGTTNDVKRRLAEHNAGESPHTAKHRPWKLIAALYFDDSAKAEAFGRYLKGGSGHAFAERHLW